WNCFHCQRKGHFKRDCLELKDNDESAHVVEDEGYEHGEALVMSSWEPEESGTQNSDDARDSEELGDFGLVVSEELERSCMLQG
ncbi:acylamino-acid-releasing enzyme, partial [Trifolium medium]|nr:acylamino-acid-releasing enzyme [Trifolium medium]